jgi:lipoyl(octanoyl) transferase
MVALRKSQVCWLGQIEYQSARHLQESLAIARSEELIPDTLLLLEHPPTITLGRLGKEENLLVTRELLKQEGVAVYRTDRGGDVTYHGPGQLVGYPVVNLKYRPGRTGGYLRDLEQVLITSLQQFGLTAVTLPGLTGVWVGNEKIAAIGVKVNARRISGHGFALNVTTDLSYFDKIIPCGILNKGVTSLERILGIRPSLTDVAQVVSKAFFQVFDAAPMETCDHEQTSWQ